jgi:hypothetical protein
MTGKERVMTAVNRQVSDRTPITFDAEDEVYEALYAHLGDVVGFILGPGHTYIQVDAPLENMLAMHDAAFSYRCGA